MPDQGTSQNRYLIEVDGVAAVRASEATPPDKKQSIFKLFESNRPNPRLGRGNFEISEVSIKHGYALNNAGTQFFQWLSDFCSGQDLERRNCRLIILDEDGLTPVDTYELERCVPISFKPETLNSGGTDPAYFTFMLQPEDFTRV